MERYMLDVHAAHVMRALVRARVRARAGANVVDGTSLRPVTARAAIRLLRPVCLCRLTVLVPVMC